MSAGLVLCGTTNAQTVLLFANDFSSPNQEIVGNCGPDLDATLVNTLWGGTGTGTGGGGLWAQQFTVETILINGPSGQYTDTEAIGGDFCVSMLSTINDDRAAFTLDCELLPFVNLYMDVSSIDLAACGGPFGLAQPSFHVSVYDTPSGVFDFGSLGVLLDEDTLFGVVPSGDPFTFTWSSVSSGLSVAGSSNGMITVVLDVLSSPYMALDNIQIEASVIAAGISDHDGATSTLGVWPNPTKGILNIPEALLRERWSIMDNMGSPVATDLRADQGKLDLNWLAQGIYLLHSGNGRAIRFIKE